LNNILLRKTYTTRTKVDKIDVTVDGKFAHVLRPAARLVPSWRDIKKDCGPQYAWNDYGNFVGSMNYTLRNL
jgi:hypothetical protein